MELQPEVANIMKDVKRRRAARNSSRRFATQAQLISVLHSFFAGAKQRTVSAKLDPAIVSQTAEADDLLKTLTTGIAPGGGSQGRKQMNSVDEALNKWLEKAVMPAQRELSRQDLRFGVELLAAVVFVDKAIRQAQRILARGHASAAEGRKLASQLELLVADLERYAPLINDFLKLFGKCCSVELTLAEALDAIEDDVLRLEVEVACRGL